ncbi:MAG: hypothetical protein J6J44_02655 [Lachnospiraceae bacterium]|nr:hypothetical protein [Lachnospiraceae bacterium]
MSWCPKCKNEYRAGITVCPDCNEELMEELTEAIELEFVPLFQTDNEELKTKLVKYLVHCGRKVQEQSAEAETEEGLQTVYAIFVPKDDYAEAVQEIRTVIAYDAKQEAGEEDLKPRHRAPEPSTLYVDAKSRYQEYKSSGIMFLAFAVLFLIFGILNLVGVINIMASTVSLIIVFGAVVGFAYVGITSLMKVSSLEEEASAEENVTEDILDYLKSEFPKEEVEKILPAGANAEDLTNEELYFVRISEIKNYVMSEYPGKDENYLDALIEDYYNSLDL